MIKTTIILAMVAFSALSLRIRQEEEYVPGSAIPGLGPKTYDSFYNKQCTPRPDTVDGDCGGSDEYETEWKNAISCGWWNGYDTSYVNYMALRDSVPIDEEAGPEGAACVSAIVQYKTGAVNCEQWWQALRAYEIWYQAWNVDYTTTREDIADIAEAEV